MKLALAILALVVFALSFVADYKWRQWMAKRRTDLHPSQPPARTTTANPDNPPKTAAGQTKVQCAASRL